MIKNAKLSGYYFYMNLNICGDFQICNNVPLIKVSPTNCNWGNNIGMVCPYATLANF